MEESSEAKELELLERVFLRVGAAEDDHQLEKTLERFLVPTILKSDSVFQSVKDKVLELLTHMKKRLNNRPAVQLPLNALLSQFSDPQSPPQVTNLSLVYIKLGYPRLPGAEQSNLLPVLINALDSKTASQQHSVLQLVLPSLVHFILPRDVTQQKALFQFEETPRIKSILLEFIQCYLLLPYGVVEGVPPGLSQTLVNQVTDGHFLESNQLEKVKLSCLKLLSSDLFSADEVITHALVAAGDPRHSVTDQGDSLLKQCGSSVDWESSKVIHRIFSLCQGTVAVPGKKRSRAPTNPQDHVTPASLRGKLRVMPFLMKSTYAANCFPACVQVIFENLFGAITNARLKTQTLQFVHHICTSATDHKLSLMSPILVTGIGKITDQPSEDAKLQALAYTALGCIAKRVPMLFQMEPKHLSRLFSALKMELPQDVCLAVQECLGLMAAAYRMVKEPNATLVEAIIVQNIFSSVTQVRMASTQYAFAVFPFHHIPSRFVCMIACGDRKQEVRDEGVKGLKQPSKNDNGWEERSCNLPDFCSMVEYTHKRAMLEVQSGHCYSTDVGSLPFRPPMLSECLKFLRMCLLESAGVTEEQRMTSQTLKPIAKYLAGIAESEGESLTNYLDLLKRSLGPAADSDLQGVAMGNLLEVVAGAPLTTAKALSSKIHWIAEFTHSSRPETREPAARLVGILAGQLEPAQFMTLAEQILLETSSENYSVQHGAVASLGHVVGNYLRNTVGENVDQDVSSVMVVLVRKSLQRLVNLLSSVQISQLASSACAALGDIFRSGPLPLLDGDERMDSNGCIDDTGSIEGELTKAALVDALCKQFRSGKEMKMKARCALSLGYLSVGDPLFPLKRTVLEGLFQGREEKALDLQFTIGEALACTAAGSFCSSSLDLWRLSDNKEESHTLLDTDIMTWTLETILSKYTFGTSPIVRQSSCVWLLSLLKFAGKHPEIQNLLKRIQMTFMNMLAEQNDVIQEMASRGLSLVYELSEASQKGELVEMLVGTLLEGRKQTEKVTGDTKLFEEGELGKIPKSGGNLSTYKELCSLASDLNKPDLVYKFMNLANHKALWNSKKGAAFGFSNIASQAQEQLAPYLPTLVPRLYRYKYDPSPRIQLAMSNIWGAVVPQSKKTVDKYLKEILADLIANLNSNLWRNREASCLALSDLLVSRQIGEVADYLPQLWELCLRVRDDVKESSRKAADSACKSLHKVTVRSCDGSTMSKSGKQVIQSVLPLLLNIGMTNPASEVRNISLITILKLAQNAGALLKPHVAVLVPTLLESVSSLETQSLNTLSLQLSGVKMVQEKLDDIRVSVSKSSPMIEIVNLCVPQVDSEVLNSLTPRLVDILKSGVGLATKVASANFVISLVQQCVHDLTPFTGKLLNGLTSGLSDRSAAVRKAYAKAIGHLIKVAKASSISKLITKLRTWYFERDDDGLKASIAQVFHAIATHSHDVAKNTATEFLPLVFLAMHAKPKEDDPSSEATIKQWKDTWNDLVPGTASGVKLYLPDLVSMVTPSLQAQSWVIKAQGAAAIATITEKMGSNLGPPHLSTLLTSLLNGLGGRTWNGKEALLKAVSTLCVSCKSALLDPQDASQPTPEEISMVLLGQCKKQDPKYKAIAVETTGNVVEALHVDVFSDLQEVLIPVLLPEGDTKPREDYNMEEEERRESTAAKLGLQVKVFTALGQAWPSVPSTQRVHYSHVIPVLSSALPLNNWRVQVAILSSLCNIFERLVCELGTDEEEFLSSDLVPGMCKSLGTVRYSAVRYKAILALDQLTLWLQKTHHHLTPEAVTCVRDSLQTVTDQKHYAVVQAIGGRVSTLEKH